MFRKLVRWVGSVALLLVIGHFALTNEIYTEVGYICENTGSSYGYRLWPGGLKTRKWSRKSDFQAYLESKRPALHVEHRWSRSAFMGTNIFGEHISFSCGPLGGMVSLRRSPELETWMRRHSEEEVFELYDFFRAADYKASRDRADAIREEARGYSAKKSL